MRLIDAEQLDKEGWILRREVFSDGKSTVYEQMFPSAFRTIEAEPIRRGRWIARNEAVECSVCKAKYSNYWDIQNDILSLPWSYCPHCGAKMEDMP